MRPVVRYMLVPAMALALIVGGCGVHDQGKEQMPLVPGTQAVDAALQDVLPSYADGSLGSLDHEALNRVKAGTPINYWTLWSYEPSKGTAFDQMTQVRGGVTVPMLLDGEVCGSFSMGYENGEWGTSGAGGTEAAQIERASDLIRAALGAHAEVRAVVGPYNVWVMGHLGAREAAVFWDRTSMYAAAQWDDMSKLPQDFVVYSGDQLQSYLDAIGTAGEPVGK